MRTRLAPGVVNRDRRRLLITMAAGIAAAVAAGTVLATSGLAQSASEIRGVTDRPILMAPFTVPGRRRATVRPAQRAPVSETIRLT